MSLLPCCLRSLSCVMHMECKLTHASVSLNMLRNNTCTNVKLEAAEVKWHLLLSLPVLSNTQDALQKTADSLTATHWLTFCAAAGFLLDIGCALMGSTL